MQLTREKINYLMFLYEHQENNYTVTKMAQHIGISKSTLSRVLNSFYQEGLTLEKGKAKLSCLGCKQARQYKKEIQKLTNWLIHTADFNQDDAYQEALSLILSLSDQGKLKLVNHTNIAHLFELIENIKYISGDMLSANLDDGQYSFAFTVYKEDGIQISMANDGFVHPGILNVNLGHGELLLTPKEVERESIMGKMTLKGKLSSLKYQIDNDYLESEYIQDRYIIPISQLHFYYSKEERILQASLKIRVQANVGLLHMPESDAIMTLIIK